jgi:hypothetical protein
MTSYRKVTETSQVSSRSGQRTVLSSVSRTLLDSFTILSSIVGFDSLVDGPTHLIAPEPKRHRTRPTPRPTPLLLLG